MNSAVPGTLDPIKIGNTTLPNRFVMGSMHTGLEGHDGGFEALGRFYAERAKAGCALVVTGGFSPNFAGRIKDVHCTIDGKGDIEAHRKITSHVHEAGGRILLQLLHAGRYSYHPAPVAPSPLKSPLNRDVPAELSETEILQTIEDYAETARRALLAGYDGIEIMGSEGYLISQFLAERTNKRVDDWGGSFDNRMRFPLLVTRAVREALGDAGMLGFRMSALDLVEGGMTKDEILTLAQGLEEAGADLLGTGVGWHESAVPTIAGAVPHGAFADAMKAIKETVSIPVAASNRINLPETAEEIIGGGYADLIYMARPFLADAEFVAKYAGGRRAELNICIACNQACLDHYFSGQPISCLVNPRAAREQEFQDVPATAPLQVAIVGAGVAGIACALEAAKRGHQVTLFDGAERIGGQLKLAAVVPGKTDYGLAIDGFEAQLRAAGVDVRLGHWITAEELASAGFDEIVLSTGITARELDLPGADGENVVSYTDVLNGTRQAGPRVVIIGAGGIGHDVALFLSHGEFKELSEKEAFAAQWGVGREAAPAPAAREVTMLKRSDGRFGKTLGKTTGWILRQELRDCGVQQFGNVTYQKIDANGIDILVDNAPMRIDADTIVVCAGQLENDTLSQRLMELGCSFHVIGGAKLALELDAKRAIDEGARLGNRL
ncbi:FAD-dependent oxidoreductase [Roseovarius sp. E0-M6]|uniref:FAD-dependent oxidoreductase n=1 Tax=Roseovarius sp. E0-M6 TaxID=3127118 RepID=UPI00300FE392